MAIRCDNPRRWIEGADGDPGDAAREHLAACPVCRARLATYRAAVDLGRASTCQRPADLPPFDAVRRRAEGAGSRRGKAGFAWVPAGLAVAGSVAAVAIGLALSTPTDPDIPAPGVPPPPTATSPGTPPPSSTLGDPDQGAPAGPFLMDASGVALDGRPIGAAEGDVPVRPGQTVQTAGASSRIVDLRTASLVLDPGSRLVVQAWADDAVRIRLEEGRIACDVLHRETGQSFEVATPWGFVQVVGTRFAVTSDPGRGMLVEVFDGHVSVRAPDGTEAASVVAGGTFLLDSPTPAARAPRLASLTRPPEASGTSFARTLGVRPSPATAPPTATPPELRRLLSAGRPDDALAEIARALAAAPGDQRPRLLALLGDAHRLAGRFPQALAGYEAALAEGGDRAPEGVYADLADLLQRDLGRPDRSAEVWRRYLDANPAGRYASRALWALASLPPDSLDAGDRAAARRRIVADFPWSPEAVPAFVEGGRDLLERGDAEAAEAWYSDAVASPAPALREAALVGLMSVAYRRHDAARLRELGRSYLRDFPSGTRTDEARRLLDGIAGTP